MSMNLQIAIVTPSRERSALFEVQLKSFLQAAADISRIRLYCYLDSDDPHAHLYERLSTLYSVNIIKGAPGNFSLGINQLAMRAVDDGCDVIVFGNDDALCSTSEWDIKIDQHFSGSRRLMAECLLLGTNASERFAFPAVTRGWIKAVGHLSPGVFHFYYHDTWIFDISERAGCTRFADDIHIDHRHASRMLSGYVKDSTHYRNSGRLIQRLLRRISCKRLGVPSKMELDAEIYDSLKADRILASLRIIDYNSNV